MPDASRMHHVNVRLKHGPCMTQCMTRAVMRGRREPEGEVEGHSFLVCEVAFHTPASPLQLNDQLNEWVNSSRMNMYHTQCLDKQIL
jgi:hypothetical protein